jgi:hypothetical protein
VGALQGKRPLETVKEMGDGNKTVLRKISGGDRHGWNRLSVMSNAVFGIGTAEHLSSSSILLVTSTPYLGTFCQINSTE